MVSLNTVESDEEAVKSCFAKFTDSINSLNSEQIWQGKSKDNAFKVTQEFVESFENTIIVQFENLNTAIELFNRYNLLDETRKSLANAINSATNTEELSTYQKASEKNQTELSELKAKIINILESISSNKLESDIILGNSSDVSISNDSIPTIIKKINALSSSTVVTGIETTSSLSEVKDLTSEEKLAATSQVASKESSSFNYHAGSVDGTKIVVDNYSMNDVMLKIKESCEQYGIGNYWTDVCAISLWETGNYTSTAFKNKYNVGGIMYNGSVRNFDSLDSGIDKFVSNLAKNYYNQNLTTLSSIGNKYCPEQTGHWINGVSKMKSQIENCL